MKAGRSVASCGWQKGILLLAFVALLPWISSAGEKELETRYFPVFLSMFSPSKVVAGPVDPFASADGKASDLSPVQGIPTPQQVLERAGVEFGEGAFAKIVFKKTRWPMLMARNTPDQLEYIEVCVGPICQLQTKQITVIVDYIEVDAVWLGAWILGHRLDRDGTPFREEVQKLVRTGSARMVDTCIVAARSGQRAKTESVREYFYPETGNPPRVSQSVAMDGEVEAGISPLVPSSFDFRALGITLETDPVIAADGTTVALILAPLRGQLDGQTNWPLDNGDARFRQVLPRFFKDQTATQLSVTDGNYELIGTVEPLESGLKKVRKTEVLIFVRADIGRPMAGYGQ